MLTITKLDLNDIEIIQLLSTPISKAKLKGFPIRYFNKDSDSSDIVKLKNKIITNKSILLLLAKHIFYYNNIDESKKLRTSIHLNHLELNEGIDILGQIFDNVIYNEVLLEGFDDKLHRLVIGRVSDVGLKIFNDMISENLIPKAIYDLYVNNSISTDLIKPGLYLVEGDCENSGDISLWETLCNNQFNNNIDISSMSLVQCQNSNLIKYLVKSKKKVYIYVEKLMWCNTQIKSVIWY